MRITSRFGSNVVAGTWVSKTEVQCSSPEHAEGNVYVEIAPSARDPYSNDRVWIVIIIRGKCKTTKYRTHMHTRTQARTYTYTHTHTLNRHALSTHTCTHARTHTHTHTQPTHARTRTRIRTYTFAHPSANSNIQTYAYTNERAYLQSWIYRRTFARTSNSKTINLHRLRLSYRLPANDIRQETFAYYALCPESACGSMKTPSRGVCSMGRCLCSVPWRGDDCEILGLAPKITPVSLQTITEGSNFEIVMTTSEVCSTVPPSYRKQLD